jgi:hypothetical protein
VGIGDSEFKDLTRKFGHLIKHLKTNTVERHGLIEPFVSPQFYHLISPIKKILMMLGFSLFA